MNAFDTDDIEPQLQAQLNTLAAEIDFADPALATPAGVAKVAQYVQLLFDAGLTEEAASMAGELKRLLDMAAEQHPGDPDLVEPLLRWMAFSRRFDLVAQDHFGAWDDYAAARPLLEAATPRHAAARAQAQLLLLAAYETWLQRGGNTNRLDEQVREHLTALAATGAEGIAEAALAQAATPDDTAIVERGRIAYYATLGKPNEANVARKRLLALLPQLPGYQTTDTADVQMELGITLAQYRKHAAALPYFEAALSAYTAAGPAFEALAYQAESWVDECRANQ